MGLFFGDKNNYPHRAFDAIKEIRNCPLVQWIHRHRFCFVQKSTDESGILYLEPDVVSSKNQSKFIFRPTHC